MEENKIQEILDKITKIEDDITEIKVNSYKMVKHISFIENLYETMKKPLGKILSFFSS